ncbi:MAG TPA: MurR/RpiR family transcriptional regulator [Anaerolineae bacterium]|nr:MurR/RpiR family transcriptional regulator [Anaerolineae bacterium]
MFRERITRNYQSLSPSFKKIADFILTAHQRVAFMSASRLAKHLGVDVATVTRFAQQLGYDGYTQLIREIQEKVLEEMREARAPVTDRLDAAEGPVAQTLWRDWTNLEKTIQNIPQEQIEAALAALGAARRIFLVSEGVGAGLAHATAAYLRMCKQDVFPLTQGKFDLALSLKDLSSEDLVIGIGFTAYAYAATQALKLGRKVGAKTIGIIAQADCPVGGVAEILFSCSATEEGYLPSPTGVGAILFALIYSLLLSDTGAYSRELIRFQEAYADLTEGTARGDEDVVEDLMGRF